MTISSICDKMVEAAKAANFFDHNLWRENLYSRCAEFQQAFKNYDFAGQCLLPFATLSMKYDIAYEHMNDYYQRFEHLSEWHLKRRYDQVCSQAPTQYDGRKESYKNDLRGLIGQAKKELTLQILADLMAHEFISFPGFTETIESKNVAPFLAELLKVDFVQNLSQYNVQLDGQYQYWVLCEVQQKICNALESKLENVSQYEPELIKFASDFRINSLVTMISSRVMNCDLYRMVIESQTMDEFQKNIEKYNRWVFKYNFLENLSSIATGLTLDNQAQILKLVFDRIAMDISVHINPTDTYGKTTKKIELDNIKAKLNAIVSSKVNLASLPDFEMLPSSSVSDESNKMDDIKE